MDIIVDIELRCLDFFGTVDGFGLVRYATGEARWLSDVCSCSLSAMTDGALLASKEDGRHSGQSGRSGGSGAPVAAQQER